MHRFVQPSVDAAKGKFIPDSLAIPPSIHGLLATMPVSDLQPNQTVWATFLATSPYIRSESQVTPWYLLETAFGRTVDAAGVVHGSPLMVVYRKDPKAGEFYIPMEAKAIPPQYRNLAVVVNIWGKVGGWLLRQPLAYRYVTSLGPAV